MKVGKNYFNMVLRESFSIGHNSAESLRMRINYSREAGRRGSMQRDRKHKWVKKKK